MSAAMSRPTCATCPNWKPAIASLGFCLFHWNQSRASDDCESHPAMTAWLAEKEKQDG